MQRQQRQLFSHGYKPKKAANGRNITETFYALYLVIRDHSRIHQSLIALTIFVLLNNNITAHAAQADLAPVDQLAKDDPYQIADTYRLLKDYIPGATTDPDALADILQKESGIVSVKHDSPEGETPQGAITTPSPTPTASVPSDTHYVVQIGDTLSEIASQFHLKVASIQVKNKLSDIDSLKPGEDLLIPAQDLSDKALQAAQDRQTAALRSATKKVATISASRKGLGLIVPIHSKGISRGIQPGHDGIDYRADVGTPVAAAADGVVIIADSSGWNGGFGKTILISHGSGLTTRYGHLSEVDVKTGQTVQQGQTIAKSGNTGNSTGPHLHFETRLNGRVVKPYAY